MGFSAFITGLGKFNLLLRLKVGMWQVIVINALTEFYCPLSSLALPVLSSGSSSPFRGIFCAKFRISRPHVVLWSRSLSNCRYARNSSRSNPTQEPNQALCLSQRCLNWTPNSEASADPSDCCRISLHQCRGCAAVPTTGCTEALACRGRSVSDGGGLRRR